MTLDPSGRSPTDLELVKDGIRLVALTFGVDLYSNRSLYACPAEVLSTFDAFLRRVPAASLNYYATETMKVHKAVNKRTLGMLETWLKPEAPRKHYIALELKSTASQQAAPDIKYEVWAEEASQDANVVSIALPVREAQESPEEMLAFVKTLADIFPFRCGLAGYAFECSRYAKQASETHAWNVSMRHPGIDIVRLPYDAQAVGPDGVKGANWLTLLGDELVAELGGANALRTRLSSDIDILPCNNGIILKAGSSPSTGDVNRGETLPLYREVYRLLERPIVVAAKRSMSFQLVDDFVERTEAWYQRLGG
jgi:hypothetical protein